MELFDIYNPDGTRTGVTKERSLVHRDGDLHAAVHIFFIRDDPDGSHQLLLQMRSYSKDSFPGQLDTSCAGHLSAGDDFIIGAMRECREEMGLDITESDLEFLYDMRIDDDTVFYGEPFRNHELVKVFRAKIPVNIEDIVFAEDEIEFFTWMDLRDVFDKVMRETGEICIYPPGLDKLYHIFYPDDERHLTARAAVHG